MKRVLDSKKHPGKEAGANSLVHHINASASLTLLKSFALSPGKQYERSAMRSVGAPLQAWRWRMPHEPQEGANKTRVHLA